MAEHIERVVSTTIFLILILLLRAVFYKRVSRRVCYAMWLVVGIHLLASFGEFSNSFQILNVIYKAAAVQNGSDGAWNDAQGNKKEKDDQEDQAFVYQERSQRDSADDTDQNLTSPIAILDTDQGSDRQAREQMTKIMWGKELWAEGTWLKRIWLAGCIICVVVFAGSDLHFAKRLQKNRKLLETDRKFRRLTRCGYLPVYQTEEISIPCLFGVVRPAIYLPDTQIEPEKCDHVLIHEYTHYRHGDPIWAVFRCICVSLYWYHPLVWLAAFLSGRDSEFACDEGVIRTYDVKERKAYGETLILFGTGGRDSMRLLTGASGINGGDRELKKRITLIAEQRKQYVGIAVMAGILLLGATGCTIGSPVAENEGSTTDMDAVVENNLLITWESDNDFAEDHIEELAQAESGELSTEANVDLVPEPYDFARILEKTEENGIEYYKVITEKEMPLPLDEWAKINIFTEKGNAVDAYVRFTQVIRDVDEIKEHVDHYIKVREIKEPFGMLETVKEQCVLLQYEILIAGDAKLEESDRILSMALDYPLRLYSTTESGRFTNQGIERSVCDLSILEQDRIEPGDTIKKEVICYIPKDYTAYGMELAYMTAQRTTNMVYFKPEYDIGR